MPVILRPAQPDDCALMAQWLNDPAVNALLSSNWRRGGADPRALAVALRRRDLMWFVFAPADGEAPVGLVALDSIDPVDGTANIWFLLGEARQRGRGLTSAAIEAFCRLNPAGLHVLTAWIVDGNTASVACLTRAGFRPIGRVSGGAVIDGGRRDRLLMERVLDRH